MKRKYRQLFSPKRRGKPGPKGPSPELIAAIVETKRLNPSWGCRRIAQQLCLVFGLEIDRDVIRRVLAKHYRPDPGAYGPSWLTVLGHTKDSLWSIDLFRCESLILKSHWVLIVMDQFTRESLDSVYVPGPSMDHRCAECSTMRSVEPDRRDISAVIMTPCSGSIGGRLIFEDLM